MADVQLSRAEVAGVLAQGAQAARDGLEHRACPWSPNAEAAEDRVRAAAWMRGYVTTQRKLRG